MTPGSGLRRQDHQHAAACGPRLRPIISTFRRSVTDDFVGAVAETLEAESLTRVLYPDDSTSMGKGCVSCRNIFWSPARLADLVRRFRRSNTDWNTFPEKVAIQLNDTHPAMAVPELMRILLDERVSDGTGVGHHAKDAGLYESHAAARSVGEMAARLV